MKTISQLTDYYYKALYPKLETLEKERKILKSRVNSTFIPIAILILIAFFILLKLTDISIFFGLIFLLLLNLTAYGLISQAMSKKYKKNFKTDVVAPLIKHIDKNLTYKKDEYISKEMFLSSKIGTQKIDSFTGDDLIYGTIMDVKIKCSEITVHKRSNGESDLAEWGLFICAEFVKHFKAHTIITSNMKKDFGKVGGTLINKLNKPEISQEYKDIKMDSPEFNKNFIVHSTDEIEARYILSHSLMERIIQYNKHMDFPLTISFIGGNIYLYYSCGPILNPSIQTSLLDFKAAKNYALTINFALNIVEILKLNEKLWSKY